MLVPMLELQRQSFPSHLPIREESVKWRNTERGRDCFNLWKTETFPLEEQLLGRTMKAASDSTLKRAELLLASLLMIAWKLHSLNSETSFSRSYKSLHFHRPAGKDKAPKTTPPALHLTKLSELNNSI